MTDRTVRSLSVPSLISEKHVYSKVVMGFERKRDIII